MRIDPATTTYTLTITEAEAQALHIAYILFDGSAEYPAGSEAAEDVLNELSQALSNAGCFCNYEEGPIDRIDDSFNAGGDE